MGTFAFQWTVPSYCLQQAWCVAVQKAEFQIYHILTCVFHEMSTPSLSTYSGSFHCHASEIFLWSEIWWNMGTFPHSIHSEVLQSEVLRLMVKCSYIAPSQTSVTISKLECCPCSFWVGLCQAHPKINSQVIFFPLRIAPTLLVTDDSNQHTLHWDSFLWESCRGILQRSASCRASRISVHFVFFSGSCFILLFFAM